VSLAKKGNSHGPPVYTTISETNRARSSRAVDMAKAQIMHFQQIDCYPKVQRRVLHLNPESIVIQKLAERIVGHHQLCVAEKRVTENIVYLLYVSACSFCGISPFQGFTAYLNVVANMADQWIEKSFFRQ